MALFQGIKENYSLKKHNTFGLDVKARYFIEVADIQQLKSVVDWSVIESVPLFVLGGGSNVLFTQNLDFLVIKNSLKGIEIVEESESEISVKIGAGEVWHEVVLHCIDKGWGGVENLSLIPGSIGAAPMQNIGAYGVELKDVFQCLEAFNLETKAIKDFSNDECQFGYRDSVFKNQLKGKYVITSVTLRLNKSPKVNTSYGAISEVLAHKGILHPTIKDVSDAVIEIRQSKLTDPAKIGNSGSFFKNPVISDSDFQKLKTAYPNIPSYPQENSQVKVPAGWLIEQCGWKGKMRGDIGVHKQQALVLINQGGGKGQDIRQLAMDIQESVSDKFGINLETEVNIF